LVSRLSRIFTPPVSTQILNTQMGSFRTSRYIAACLKFV
jgi:hypothetical protein